MDNEINSSGIFKVSKHIYYVPSLKKIYIGHFCLNFLCLGPAIIFQYAEVYFLQNIVFPYLQNSKKAACYFIFIIIFYITSLLIFIIDTITGPGYLPFNYFSKGMNIKDKIDKGKELKNLGIDNFENQDFDNYQQNDGNELGIVINEDDIKKVNSVLMINLSSSFSNFRSFFTFLKLPPIISPHQPPLADYIVSERRYVIRPLVFDNLNGSWVGKKNAKLFILYRFFLSAASLMICFSFLDILINFVEDYCFGAFFLECMIIFIFILCKAFFQIILCLKIINKIAFTKCNRLQINNDTHDENIYFSPSEVFRNFKVFFGDNPFCWLLPIPPFHGFSDKELYSIEKRKYFLS